MTVPTCSRDSVDAASSRIASFAVLVMLVASLASCGSDACPESWDSRFGDSRTCEPPSDVLSAAERRLGTGIFGYALSCESNDDEDSCDCDVEGLLVEGGDVRAHDLGFDLNEYDRATGVSRTLRVPVNDDATFEVKLAAGLEYTFSNGWIDETRDDGFTLAEDEVRFLRIVVVVSC